MYRSIITIFLLISIAVSQISAESMNSAESRKGLGQVVRDYIALYQKDTLSQWKELFHPSAMIFFPDEDGTITVRNREEFYDRQKKYFDSRKSISERLENVQIFEGRKIARLVGDYIFIDEGEERRGKLGLHIVEGKDGWKIVDVVFSYDNP